MTRRERERERERERKRRRERTIPCTPIREINFILPYLPFIPIVESIEEAARQITKRAEIYMYIYVCTQRRRRVKPEHKVLF